jgi:enamine deaminase RidA (YjgF/YER057c/UK114 family)
LHLPFLVSGYIIAGKKGEWGRGLDMAHRPLDVGIAKHIGTYSDAILVPPNVRWLISAGTPGMAPDGTTPEGITAQAVQAWTNIMAMLEQAGMGVQDLVKVTHYLVRQEDIKPYVAVRAKYLGDARPASMLLIVPALVRPEFLLEIEICAAKLVA